jgi:hypothetical protein
LSLVFWRKWTTDGELWLRTKEECLAFVSVLFAVEEFTGGLGVVVKKSGAVESDRIVEVFEREKVASMGLGDESPNNSPNWRDSWGAGEKIAADRGRGLADLRFALKTPWRKKGNAGCVVNQRVVNVRLKT